MDERCGLTWTKVVKPYVFRAPPGLLTLADLFDGRSQLIVQHCSLRAWKSARAGYALAVEEVEGLLEHLHDRDAALVAVSRAPLSEIEAFKERIGWPFQWLSSNGNDFNYDFHVSFHTDESAREKESYNYVLREHDSEELPGMSLFCKCARGEVFHVDSVSARDDDLLSRVFDLLSVTAAKDAGAHAQLASPSGQLRESIPHAAE